MPPSNASAKVRSADTGTSVRARSRHDPADPQRKPVYKPVLANPLSIDWPPLPATVRRAILDQLLAVLADSTTSSGKSIADWRLDEHARRRGNTRVQADKPDKGKRKVKGQERKRGKASSDTTASSDSQLARESHTVTTRSATTYSVPTSQWHPAPSSSLALSEPAPPLLSDLVIGINQVTRALETRIRWGRWELGDRSAVPSSSLSHPEPSTSSSGQGHRRRHKPSTAKNATSTSANPVTVIPPSSSRAPQPLPLADHPAYAFCRDRAALPSKHLWPPYVIDCQGVEGGAEAGGAVRLLVNSDARRVAGSPRAGKRARPADERLIPTQPEVETPVGEDAEEKEEAVAEPAAPMIDVERAESVMDEVEQPSESAARAPSTVPLVDLILVCRPDINPPSLVAHLPTMVAAANGVLTALESVLDNADTRASDTTGVVMGDAEGQADAGKRPEMRKVLLVPLDAGAELKLADALGLRRVAAIGLSSLSPQTAPLLQLITTHLSTPLSAPWLVPHLLHPPPSSSMKSAVKPPVSRFAPTAIKHLKTSAPLNPRKAVTEKKDLRRRLKEEKSRKRRRVGEHGQWAGGPGAHDNGVYVAED